jgi:hypothetical protein
MAYDEMLCSPPPQPSAMRLMTDGRINGRFSCKKLI